MPTNVVPLVIDEYTAVVNIPSDGEVPTETGISNMMVAALNRTEHVRQNIPALSTKIPQIVDIHEEFMSVFYDTTNEILHAGRVWKTTSTGTPSLASTGSFLGNIGGVTISLTANNEEVAIHAGASPTAPAIPADVVDRFACLIRPDTALGDMTIRVGFAQDMLDADAAEVGIHGLCFFIEPGDTNWSVRTRTAGGVATVDSGVPFVQSDIFLFEIIQTSAGNWSCLINTVEVAAFSDPADDVITDEQCNFGVHVHAASATTINVGLLYLGLRTVDLGARYD